jgi:hypothetical protein
MLSKEGRVSKMYLRRLLGVGSVEVESDERVVL